MLRNSLSGLLAAAALAALAGCQRNNDGSIFFPGTFNVEPNEVGASSNNKFGQAAGVSAPPGPLY